MAENDDTPGAELVVYQTADEAIEALRGKELPAIEDPEQIAAQIVERILASTSVEQVLGGSTAVGARDLLDVPLMLHAVRFSRSAYEDGPGVFAILDAERGDTGERVAVTCGSRNVMAQAAMLWKLDALPMGVTVRQSDTPTAAGFRVLWLEAA